MLQCEDTALRNEEIIMNIKAFMVYRLAEIVIFAFGYYVLAPISHSLKHAETFVFDRLPPAKKWFEKR
jgi:hypothetical protein